MTMMMGPQSRRLHIDSPSIMSITTTFIVLLVLSFLNEASSLVFHGQQQAMISPRGDGIRRITGAPLYQAAANSDDATSGIANAINHAAAYASHWDALLLSEHQNTAAEFKARRKHWSRRRLENSGMSIFGASAEPDSDLLGEKIVRIIKSETSTPLQDKFTRGDVLVLTTTSSGSNDASSLPRECLVVDVGSDWLTVGVGPSWPAGLFEARKVPGHFRVRLDRTAPQAPLRAQRTALELVRKGNGAAGEGVRLLADVFFAEQSTAGKWIDDATSRTPSRLLFLDEGDKLEQKMWKALDGAKQVTKFQPNKSQEEAIVWALQRRVSLIRGPPGTGKTRVAALLISTALNLQQHLPKAAPNRILAVTHSNGAADVLLQALLQMGVPAIRLGRPASVSASVQHRTVIAMAEKHPEVVRARAKARDMSLQPYERALAAKDIQRCLMDVQKSIAKTAPVIVTTCIGANQLLVTSDDSTAFPLVVLDEAAQTTEPALVCALSAARAEQVVLVGDTRQLPPTIASMELRATLGVSPMARLEKSGVGQKTLSVQYRMPPALLKHPSSYFYSGLVVCADELLVSDDEVIDGSVAAFTPPKGFPWPNDQPLAFVQVGNNLEVTHDSGGKSNPTEAELVTRIVSDLLVAGEVEARNIAVISPYSKQVQRIRSELSFIPGRTKKAGDVRVGTVDSFQGQETDVVIFSCVRSNDVAELGFLRDSRRLCVAITRAKRGLVIVGDKQVLQTCRHWAALLASCTERACLVDASHFNPKPTLETDEEGSSLRVDNSSAMEDAVKELLDNKANDEFLGLFSPTGIGKKFEVDTTLD
jgi:hypothetical protein